MSKRSPMDSDGAGKSRAARPPRRRPTSPSDAVGTWRMGRLIAAGLPSGVARSIAANCGYDLHELLLLLDHGCPAELAARIAAPLEESRRPC